MSMNFEHFGNKYHILIPKTVNFIILIPTIHRVYIDIIKIFEMINVCG